jgi:acyl carrier protein
MAFTSSLSSIMGDINRIEYCAANSYLDYLSVDKITFNKTKLLSVNWPGWNDTGMAMEDEYVTESTLVNPLIGIENILHLNTMKQKEGAELFYKMINQRSHEQIVVSKLDLDKLRTTLFGSYKNSDSSTNVQIIEFDYSETEYQVAKIFADLLGINQISIHDDFFRIGGNSILAIQVSHRMKKLLGFNVKVTDLFQFKTCRALVENTIIIEVNPENIRIEF